VVEGGQPEAISLPRADCATETRFVAEIDSQTDIPDSKFYGIVHLRIILSTIAFNGDYQVTPDHLRIETRPLVSRRGRQTAAQARSWNRLNMASI
jgi:hypothetical protein